MDSFLSKIAKDFSLKLLLLFGSKVKGNFKEDSDVDLAFLAFKDLSSKDFLELTVKLSQHFKKEVDLVDLKKANPLLLYQIAKNCKLLYGKEKDFIKFKIVAFKKYVDHFPLLKLEEKIIKERQEKLRARYVR